MSFADEITKAVSQPVVLVHVDSVDAGYAGRFATTEFTPIGASVPYEGRLFSLPAIASSRDLQFFGILKYSSSGITLINADGDLDTLLEDYNILGSKVRIYYGFQDMNISTFVNIYTGYVEAATISETYANLTVSDRRKIFDTEIDDFWEEIDALTVIKETILLADTNIAFNDTYFDTTAWDAAAALAPDLTIWADEPLKRGDQIISGASLSAFGNVTIEPDGRYSFRYINQGATATTTIKKADIMNEYSIVYDSSEVLSSVIVLSGLQEDLAIEDYADLSRDTTREASVYASTGIYREQKFQTYLPTATAAASFATDILDYYCGIHGKLSVTVPMEYYAIEIGQVVEAEIDRLNTTMLGTVECEVLGKLYNLDKNTIDFDLRIVDVPTPITPQVVSVTPQYKPTDNTYAEAVEAAIPTTAPKYIGRYTVSHPTSNYSDWWLLYGTAGSAITRGVYYNNAGTAARITTSSATALQGKLVESLSDVAWAEANSFGAASDYGIDNFFTNIAAVTALIQSLFAQYIKVETGGSLRGGDRYDESGAVDDGTKPGFFISAAGACKVSGLEFSGYGAGGVQWSWPSQIGTNTSVVAGGIAGIAPLNGTDIALAFADPNPRLSMYRFDGTSWAIVGNRLTTTGATPDVTGLNSTDIAWVDGNSDVLRVYRFDGTDWAQVGSDTSVTSAVDPSITALNGTDIAYIDDANDDLRTYRFGGTTFSQLGNDLNISSVNNPSITALNETDIAFIDETNADLRTYRFDGTDWAQVGSDLNLGTITYPSITALNETDIAFIDATNDQLRIYRFDGSSWAQTTDAGQTGLTSVGFPALGSLNGTDIAYFDTFNDELRVYRFGFSLSFPYGRSLTG